MLALIFDEKSLKKLDLTDQEIEYIAEKRQEVIHSLGKISA